MLLVHRIPDRTGQYYLADLANELAPLRGAGGALDLGAARPGWWIGAAAPAIGLTGPVLPDQLRSLLGGASEETGRRPPVTRPGRIAAYDLTFTAPKSVSVLFGLGTSEMSRLVAEAHAASVAEAMGYVEARAMGARRGSGETRSVVAVSGAVAAAFTHGVSRALDPHLHSHLVVANMVHGEDGRWTAIDGRGIYAHARAAGALYGAELRHRLSAALGVEFVAARAGFEVAGVGPELIGALSSRSAQIRTNLADGSWAVRDRQDPQDRQSRAPGPPRRATAAPSRRFDPWTAAPSPRAHLVAWASERDPKDASLDPAAVVRRWASVARAAGFEPADLGRIIGRTPSPSSCAVDEHRFAARVVTSPHAALRRRDVIEAWATAVRSGTPVDEVERCVDAITEWDPAPGAGGTVRAPASVVPAPWQLELFGPRPAAAHLFGTWLEGVGAVDAYRHRWGLGDADRPLGVDRASSLSTAPAERLADHLTTERRVADVRRFLDLALRRVPARSGLALER